MDQGQESTGTCSYTGNRRYVLASSTSGGTKLCFIGNCPDETNAVTSFVYERSVQRRQKKAAVFPLRRDNCLARNEGSFIAGQAFANLAHGIWHDARNSHCAYRVAALLIGIRCTYWPRPSVKDANDAEIFACSLGDNCGSNHFCENSGSRVRRQRQHRQNINTQGCLHHRRTIQLSRVRQRPGSRSKNPKAPAATRAADGTF
jgi:hypothetical protein